MWPATDGPGPTRANIETFCEYCEAACVRLLHHPCWARAWHHNITQSLLSEPGPSVSLDSEPVVSLCPPGRDIVRDNETLPPDNN